MLRMEQYVFKLNTAKLTTLLLVLTVIAMLVFVSCKSASSALNQEPTQTDDAAASSKEADNNSILLGVDSDSGAYHDGKNGFEILKVDLKVKVEEPGTYYFMPVLLNKEGEQIVLGQLKDWVEEPHANIVRSAELSEGLNIIPVYFSGPDIRNAKFDGPYTIHVYIKNDIDKVLEQAKFVTSAYKYKDFAEESSN